MRLPVNPFSFLRALVYLKRISEALDRANELTEIRIKLDHPPVHKPMPPKIDHMSAPSVEQWNDRWSKIQSGEGADL